MSDKDKPQFKMRLDEEDPDSLFEEEKNDIRLEKLTQKVTIISILIPVLIGVILVISYMDIKSRVSTVEDSGQSGVQSLSKNLESRFSSLSVKFATLEETFKQDAQQLEKNSQILAKRLNEAEKSIRWLNKIKASRKDFGAKSAAIEANLAGARQDLQTLDESLSSLDQAVKAELTALVALVEKSENSLLSYQTLVAEKLDRTETEQIVSQQKKEIEKQLEALGLRLEKQIVLNRQRIAAVKEKVATKKPVAAKQPAPMPTPAPAVKPAAPSTGSGKDTSPAPQAPQPGEIVEQDL